MRVAVLRTFEALLLTFYRRSGGAAAGALYSKVKSQPTRSYKK
jgi:hypothetical protein